MFDELIIGPGVKELVELGFLAPAVTYAPAEAPDLSEVQIRAGEDLGREMSNAVLVGNAVEHYARLCPGAPGLAYCVGQALRPAPGKERALILDHAGNSWIHGLYDFDRSWSLEGNAKRRGGKAPVRRCPKCGALISSSTTTCPECRAVFEGQNRTPEEGIGELEEVSSVALDLRAMPYREVLTWAGGDSERLRLAARARGYKPGWIWHVWRTRPREAGP